MHFPLLNYKVVMIVSICVLGFGVGFGFYAFPMLLRKMIKGVSYFWNSLRIKFMNEISTKILPQIYRWKTRVTYIFRALKQGKNFRMDRIDDLKNQ